MRSTRAGFEIAVETNGTLAGARRPRLDLRQPQGRHRGGPALGRRVEAGLAAGRASIPAALGGWDFRHFLIQPMDCAERRGGDGGGGGVGHGAAEVAADAAGAQDRRVKVSFLFG